MPTVKDARFYLTELRQAAKVEKKWRLRAQKVVDVFRDEEVAGQVVNAKFNILWSNTQTQRPALYSSTPKPVVRRRYRHEDPLGKAMSTILQRALEYSLDTGGAYDFDRVAEKLILDYLLPGRMVARVKYHPELVESEREAVVGSIDEVPEGVEFEAEPEVGFIFKEKFDLKTSEEVRTYHVPWDKFRMSPVNCWDDVWWVAFGDNFLTIDEIVEQFGEKHRNVPLTHVDHREEGEDENADMREIKRAQVWEIWDKEAKQVVAVVEGYDKLLMQEDDPLGLRNFFPCPEPVNIVETPDKMIPIPEYCLYQSQAEELNIISDRITRLARAMKAVGLYPGDAADIPNMFKQADNTLVPVKDWAMITERGGLKGMIEWVPIKDIADVWQRLIVHRADLVQGIFELTGISDIQRGATDPRETKGAQQLKATFASRRLLPKQQAVQRFFRDILRLQAEIVAEQFSPETLTRMTAEPVNEEIMRALQDDKLRSFSIDVETDSTIAPDDAADKQAASEYLAAMSGFLQQAAPIIAAQPAAAKPLGGILLWLTRKFGIARDIEDELKEFMDAFSQTQGQPDPAQQAAAQAEQAKLQMEQQKAQLAQQEKAALIALKQQESQAEIARKDRELEAEIVRENARLEMERREREEKIRLMREEAEARVVMSMSDRSTEATKPSPPAQGVDININTDGTKADNVVPFKNKDGNTIETVKIQRNQAGKISEADLGDGRVIKFIEE